MKQGLIHTGSTTISKSNSIVGNKNLVIKLKLVQHVNDKKKISSKFYYDIHLECISTFDIKKREE